MRLFSILVLLSLSFSVQSFETQCDNYKSLPKVHGTKVVFNNNESFYLSCEESSEDKCVSFRFVNIFKHKSSCYSYSSFAFGLGENERFTVKELNAQLEKHARELLNEELSRFEKGYYKNTTDYIDSMDSTELAGMDGPLKTIGSPIFVPLNFVWDTITLPAVYLEKRGLTKKRKLEVEKQMKVLEEVFSTLTNTTSKKVLKLKNFSHRSLIKDVFDLVI